MRSTENLQHEFTMSVLEKQWTSLTDQIEERQDVKRLSTVKNTALDPNSNGSSSDHLQLAVENATFQRIQALELAKGDDVFLSSLLLSTWHFVLHTYCYSLQTVVGVFESGQDSDFVLIPSLVTHNYGSSQAFRKIIENVHCEIQKCRIQMSTTLVSSELDQKLQSLLDNVFIHCDSLSKSEFDWAGALNLPMALISLITPESLVLRIEYKSEQFNQPEVAQLLDTFVHILDQVTLNLGVRVENLALVSPEERRSILSKGVSAEIPFNQTMLTLFEEQVARVPNNVAIIFEGKHLSYAELNSKANQLANLILDTMDVRENAIIALCLSQSELIEIAILATWKTGAAYVAIDPLYPADRKSYILEDTGALAILTDTENMVGIKKVGLKQIVINVQSTNLSSLPSSKPTGFPINSDSLSHVVYTSGTTGKPKGVLTLHRALVNHCLDYPKRYDLAEDEVILLFFNYVFNAFSEPLTLALGNGFPLLLVRKSLLLEGEKFHDYMQANQVTHIDATPSLLAMLDLARIKTLRRVVPGGEILTPEVFTKIRQDVPSVRIYNVYGNSEGTLCTMTSLLDTYENSFQRSVINKQCLVLSSHLNLLPVNAIGELCFSGIGVARGYLNNDSLTRARFVTNPYQVELSHNSKLFRTGDLGRRLPSGSIEYLGRKDLQIKIRGFRVELGEIENAIRDYPGIKQSVVTATGGVKSEEIVLTGYYVLEGDSDPDAIRAHIRNFLPDYMVPTKLIRIAEMPLTANGKIDRMHLSTITVNVNNNKVQEAKPEDNNNLTQKISQIWEEVLGAAPNSIDIDEDFFDLGGNSLMAVALGKRLSAEFSVNIDAAFLYNNCTVSEFADSIRDMLTNQ